MFKVAFSGWFPGAGLKLGRISRCERSRGHLTRLNLRHTEGLICLYFFQILQHIHEPHGHVECLNKHFEEWKKQDTFSRKSITCEKVPRLPPLAPHNSNIKMEARVRFQETLSKIFGGLIDINPLNPELNPICYLLALLGAHHFLHVSWIRVKLLTFRLLLSYIYRALILDVSRSHTTTQHSR